MVLVIRVEVCFLYAGLAVSQKGDSVEIEKNRFKRAIQKREIQIGLWTGLANHISMEILKDAGFEWILIDMEHYPNEIPLLAGQLQALEGGSATPIVRPPWNDPVWVKRILDQGVFSLLFPMIQTAGEAELAVAATRYPPKGIRGVSYNHRGNRFGRVSNYLEKIEDELCVLVQIETQKALANIEDIASVNGVDGVFFGPADLSCDMGFPGQLGHPDVSKAILNGHEVVKRLGKPTGILTGIENDARMFIEAGMNFVAVGSDLALLARGSEALRKKF